MQRVFLKKEGEGMPPPIFKAPHATAEDKETSISPDTSAELEPGMSFLNSFEYWHDMVPFPSQRR